MQGRNLPPLHFLIMYNVPTPLIHSKREDVWGLKPVFRQSLPVFPAACR